MKRLFIAAVIAVITSTAPTAMAQDGTIYNLQQCVETALKNNLQVNQSTFQLQAAGVNVKQAKNNLLPSVFGNLGHGINQGRNIDPFSNSYINQKVNFANAGINSDVLLYNGGQLSSQLQQTRLIYEAAKMEVEQTKESVTLSVILAYLQILNNQDLLAQAKNQVAVTTGQVERLKTLNDAGAIIPAQYYDLKGQLANDELAVLSSRNALNQAKLILAQLMNVPYQQSLSVVPLQPGDLQPAYAKSPPDIFELSLKQLPIIKGVSLKRAAAEKGIRVARSNYFPSVSFSTGLNTNYSNQANTETVIKMVDEPSGDFVNISGSKIPVITQRRITAQQSIGYFNQFKNNYGTSFFLNINIPILNGFRARNRVALARIEEKNAALIEQTTKTQLSQAIEQAYFNFNNAVERYKTLEKQVQDFAESFRTAEVRFNAGAITQVDYLVAKNNADRSRINLIIARYDYAFRAKILDYYQGKLQL